MSEIQDPRFKIWDLSFVIFGSRHDIFVVQSSRFEIFLGNQCALSDSISLFCIFLCHMNISCSCWFFFTCPNAGRDEGELFQLLWWRAVPGGKGNGDSKTDAQKTGINNFIPCYIVSLCYQQKGFVPCWANKKTFCLLWPNFVQRVVKEKDSGGEYAAPITPKSEKRVERKRETHKGKRKVLTEEKQSWKGIEIHQKQSFDVKFRYSKI